MGAWPAVLSALGGGAAAAGLASYIVGRRDRAGVGEAAARATGPEGERPSEEARQRVALTAKEELLQAREGWEQEATRRRRELERRDQQPDERAGALEERDRQLQGRDRGFTQREQALASREQEARARLEQIAGLSAQEAKQRPQRRLEDEARSEGAALARDIKEQAKRGAEREAKTIVALASQGTAAHHTTAKTLSAARPPTARME